MIPSVDTVRRRHSESGSILVLALLVSASAAVLGIWMVVTSDLQVRRSRFLVKASESKRIANAGVEIARLRLGQQYDWAGGDVTSPDGGNQTISMEVESTGWREASVRSVAAVSDSTSTVTADLRAVPHPSLGFNVFADGTVRISGATIGGFLRSNESIKATGSIDFLGVVETTQGNTVTNKIDDSQVFFTTQDVVVPTPSLATYASMSSNLLSVPNTSGAFILDHVYLSPTSNPFGGVNTEGMYVLDARNDDVDISDCYIEGTLTILNANVVTVTKGYYHKRVLTSRATLLVEGDLDLQIEASIGETDLGVDVNNNGVIRASETYGPLVSGVIYVTDDYTGPVGAKVEGTVIALGDATLVGDVELVDDPNLQIHPVLGFIHEGSWQIVAGTVKG